MTQCMFCRLFFFWLFGEIRLQGGFYALFWIASVLEGTGKVRKMKKNNEIDTTTVGGRIQKLREENNMTQAALAEELHLENKSSISRYESNRSTPTPELFVEMARLFGTTTDYILSGEMPARSSKLMQAEAILQGMKLDKTLDAAITMLMTLKGLEQ